MKKRMSKLLMLFFLLSAGFVSAQERMVSGNVTDQDGLGAVAATVKVTGTNIGTVTDVDGNFTLEIPEGAETLTISYIGMEPRIVPIEDVINVSLMQDDNVLDDVIVTAMGIERDKASIGYAAQEIGGETLAETSETNVINALQGQVAGVQIQGTNASMGGSSRLTIRGSNSFLGNNQPLFVIDGVPVDNSSFSTNSQERGFGGATAYDYGNPISDLDPNSIETMSVLKGAAATALYGSRGANGVVLVTTKSGKGQKGLGVNVTSSWNVDEVTNLIPHQQMYGGGSIASTPSGFNELTQDGTSYLYPSYGKDGSWGPKYDPNVNVRHWDSWDPNAANYKEVRPWVAPENGYEDYFDTGLTATNGISLTGANENGNFRIGYTNTDQKDIMPGGELQTNAVSFKSGYNLSEKLNVGFTGNYTRTDGAGRSITGYNNGNPMQAFTQWWQTQLDVERLKDHQYTSNGDQYTWNAKGPVVNNAGEFQRYNFAPNYFDNPHWVRNNYMQEDYRNRFLGSANASYEILEGLKVSGLFGTDFYNMNTQEGIPKTSVEQSYFEQVDRSFRETNFEGRMSYERDFTEKFSFVGFVGGNRMRQNREFISQESQGGIALDEFYNISNSIEAPIIDTYESQRGINSAFASASFGYDDFLYLDLGGRNDWSSTLPEDNASYFYPSVSLSAVLTDSGILDNYDQISFAKIRASYAEAGTDTDPYSITPTFSAVSPNFGSFPRYNVPNALPNSNLVNELTKEYEVGLELALWNGRIDINASYFDRNTTNQIFGVATSAATGFTRRILNAGEMRNWGTELALNTKPIVTDDFSWDLGLNLFRQNNEVVELDPSIENLPVGSTWAADLRIQEGKPYMALYGQDFLRENYEEDADGNIIRNDGRRVVDENGIYKFTDQRVYLGSAIADWTGGLSSQWNYKNFSLSGLLDFQKGGVMHSASLQWSKYSGMHPETVAYGSESDTRANGMVVDGVKEDGSVNDIAVDPQTFYQSTWRRAAMNTYDASFLKLREARLSYRMPSNFLGGSMKNSSISVYGRNLAILASDIPYIDPQVISGSGNAQGLENAQVPPRRSIGLNFKFGF